MYLVVSVQKGSGRSQRVSPFPYGRRQDLITFLPSDLRDLLAGANLRDLVDLTDLIRPIDKS